MLGLAVFAATVLTAADPERNRLIRSLGLIGLIVVFGAVFELTAVIAGTDSWSALGRASAWTSMLDSSQGPAIGLRLVGGAVAAVALGWSAVRVPAVTEARQLELAAVPNWVPAGARSLTVHDRADRPPSMPVERAVSILLTGALALLLLAPTFDGHTVTSGRRTVTALTDMVHVAAGGVWIGGLAGLLVIMVGRSRRAVPLGGLRLGLRFSTVAALALALAGVAGAALAATVLDDVGQLVTTDWGRVLMLKVALVAVAGAIGAYNHFHVLRSVPRTEHDKREVDLRLRRTVLVEVAVLGAAVAATAVLVAASTTS